MENTKTFEENLKELETIVVELEKGELGLEDAILKFEKGIKVSKECNSKLEDAEKKINILLEGKEEAFEVEE